jgi:rhamnopyranosyl-N-acetylglucosaminyl-diphospho-decaprenol beta-1,3/1,4-galactofuranosyltransferase
MVERSKALGSNTSRATIGASIPTSQSPLVAIVVTFNRLSSLRTTLGAYNQENVDQILVVDNASNDGTLAWLQTQKLQNPALHVLRLELNVGGAGGFEAGLRWVDEKLGGRGWVVLHDDDAYPTAGTTARFRQRLGQGMYTGYGAVAAAVLTPTGQPADINRPILNIFHHPLTCWRRVRGTVHSLRDLYHVSNRDLLDGESLYRVDAASFVGLYLQLESLPAQDQGRYPQGELFIYGDDTLYTAHLAQRGIAIALDASLRYIHDTNTGYDQGLLRPAWKHFYISRNSLAVYCSMSTWAGPLLYLQAMLRRLKAILSYGDRALRRQSARGYWLGLADALGRRRFRSHQEVVQYVEGGSR